MTTTNMRGARGFGDVAGIAPHAANGMGRDGKAWAQMGATSPAPSDETMTDWLAIPALRPG